MTKNDRDKAIPALEMPKTVEVNHAAISVEDARAMLAQETETNKQKCLKELEKPMQEIRGILKKYNCSQAVYGLLKSGTWVPVSDLGVFADVQLVILSNAQTN